MEFTIRDDVTFHDGKKLTAEDVVFSVKRITDPKFGSPQLGQFNKITDAVATGTSSAPTSTRRATTNARDRHEDVRAIALTPCGG